MDARGRGMREMKERKQRGAIVWWEGLVLFGKEGRQQHHKILPPHTHTGATSVHSKIHHSSLLHAKEKCPVSHTHTKTTTTTTMLTTLSRRIAATSTHSLLLKTNPHCSHRTYAVLASCKQPYDTSASVFDAPNEVERASARARYEQNVLSLINVMQPVETTEDFKNFADDHVGVVTILIVLLLLLFYIGRWGVFILPNITTTTTTTLSTLNESRVVTQEEDEKHCVCACVCRICCAIHTEQSQQETHICFL
mmetsp:Transcript_1626/g.5626  ORF Transcript_1626/g.5626 Transcript_1626/m.5626 type:complete len:252 (+) Transcript_1626:1545-2300(+)